MAGPGILQFSRVCFKTLEVSFTMRMSLNGRTPKGTVSNEQGARFVTNFGKRKANLHFMVLLSLSNTSQGKSRSHDVWYFRSRLVFPAKPSGWDSAYLLSPSSFVKFNCCVAWMSSLLVTSGQNQNELNSWLLIRSPYLFVWLVHGKFMRGLSTNLPMNTCSWRKTCNSDFPAAVGFYSCPSSSSVILNHLPKRATCAACTLAKHIILLAPGKWASVSVEHCTVVTEGYMYMSLYCF